MNNKMVCMARTFFVEARGETKVERIMSYLTWAATVVSLFGAIFAAFGICTGGCSDAQNYRLFGLPFAAIGIPFFVLLVVTSFRRNGDRACVRTLYDVLLAGALGAEWIFLGVQARIIKHYCPICVIIAIAVFVAVGLRLVEVYLRRQVGVERKKNGVKKAALAFAKSLAVIGAIYAGLIFALIGISSSVDAGSGNITQDIWLGKTDSQIEVLYVGDWYCPYCREAEPVLESMLPEIGKVARYSFIDDPIHRESYNFIPANMSLLLNSKSQYHEGRKALLELASRSKNPTEADVAAVLVAKGVEFNMVDANVLRELARSEGGFIHSNGITLTPTLVFRNSKTGAQKTLVGTDQITKEKIAGLLAEFKK